ncbi:hypothetical protein [Cellulophaga sp. HaHa_2_1]|uniref:hypothetical protein n=1 Tax=Cellulophaga sp. HaHa_2_1 TaxID=2749994 RepID=UPI001C4E8AA2|nr:hypothetical protein [Cellulophaga sp. HaHa_2_1]QXP53590.1 hypothetical protein H0I24_06570 [Cellulophaga sp. HaHa_2_1]
MNKYKETFGVDISKPACRQAGVPEIHLKHVKSRAEIGSLFILLKKTLYALKNSHLTTLKITSYLTN